jgi:hypothetical protein
MDYLKKVQSFTELHSRKLKEIHSLLPNLAYGDAIQSCTFHKRLLTQCGYKSDIICRYLDQRVQEEAKVFTEAH